MRVETGLLPFVAKAAEAVGGVTKLAGLLGIKRPALYQWKRVPAERVLRIEQVAGGSVSRHDLRPDLYPRESSPKPSNTSARDAAA